MAIFQVSSPNICGLVINGGGDTVLSYLSGTFKCETASTATFEQFTTVAAAAARAVAVQSNYNLTYIFGSTTLTEVNVSDVDQQTFEGTSLTINAEHSLGGQTVSYQWKKISNPFYDDLYRHDSGFPPEVERGLTIPGATSSSLTISNPVPTMSGLYCCVVTATAADGKIGRAFPVFNVTVHDAL